MADCTRFTILSLKRDISLNEARRLTGLTTGYFHGRIKKGLIKAYKVDTPWGSMYWMEKESFVTWFQNWDPTTTRSRRYPNYPKGRFSNEG